jgi:hypothetical protein
MATIQLQQPLSSARSLRLRMGKDLKKKQPSQQAKK